MIVPRPRTAFDVDRKRIGLSIAACAGNGKRGRAIAMEYDRNLALERLALETCSLKIARGIAEEIGHIFIPIFIERLNENVIRPIHRKRMRHRIAALEARCLPGAGKRAVERRGIGFGDQVRDRPRSPRGIDEAYARRFDRVLAGRGNDDAIRLAPDEFRHRVPIRIVIDPCMSPGAGKSIAILCFCARDRHGVDRARIVRKPFYDRVGNRLSVRERHRIDEDHPRPAGTRADGSREDVRRIAGVLRLRCIRQVSFTRWRRRLLRAARETERKAGNKREHSVANRATLPKYFKCREIIEIIHCCDNY